MRQKTVIFLLLFLLFLSGCKERRQREQSSDEPNYSSEELATGQALYGPSSPHYRIHFSYSETAHQLGGNLVVRFHNNLKEDLKEVYFNLWPNAEEFESGGIEVRQVMVDGKAADFTVKDTALRISGIEIQKEQEAKVEMEFVVMIPEETGRFGWSDRQVSLGNWFPVLAVKDAKGWHTPPYFSGGESFYSVTSSFDVTFDLPEKLKVIAPGERTTEQKEAGRRLHRFQANQIRDFAAVFHTDLQVAEQEIGEVTMRLHYLEGEEEKAERMMNAATTALDTYTRSIGPYAWKELDIVSVAFDPSFNGGMEYPQLVLVNTPYLDSEEELEGTVMHEIAHQWFYATVGNDSYEEPWLDESFATFVSLATLYATSDIEWEESDECDFPITSSVADFEREAPECYEPTVYVKGARMLGDLQKELGEKVFQEGLANYYQEFTFKIATTADFIRIMEEVSGKNLKPFFEEQGVKLE